MDRSGDGRVQPGFDGGQRRPRSARGQCGSSPRRPETSSWRRPLRTSRRGTPARRSRSWVPSWPGGCPRMFSIWVSPTLGLDGGGIDLVADLERGDPRQPLDRLAGVDVQHRGPSRLAPGEGGVAVEAGRRRVSDGQELDRVARECSATGSGPGPGPAPPSGPGSTTPVPQEARWRAGRGPRPAPVWRSPDPWWPRPRPGRSSRGPWSGVSGRWVCGRRGGRRGRGPGSVPGRWDGRPTWPRRGRVIRNRPAAPRPSPRWPPGPPPHLPHGAGSGVGRRWPDGGRPTGRRSVGPVRCRRRRGRARDRRARSSNPDGSSRLGDRFRRGRDGVGPGLRTRASASVPGAEVSSVTIDAMPFDRQIRDGPEAPPLLGSCLEW